MVSPKLENIQIEPSRGDEIRHLPRRRRETHHLLLLPRIRRSTGYGGTESEPLNAQRHNTLNQRRLAKTCISIRSGNRTDNFVFRFEIFTIISRNRVIIIDALLKIIVRPRRNTGRRARHITKKITNASRYEFSRITAMLEEDR